MLIDPSYNLTNIRYFFAGWVMLFAILLTLMNLSMLANDEGIEEMEDKIVHLMEKGNIPGLALVILKGNEKVIRSFGYADLKNKVRVNANTLFELASCSKSFTALAILQLEKEGYLEIKNPVSQYLPWFFMAYQGEKYTITIKELLNHTSGIPWESISYIPTGTEAEALEQTVRGIAGRELNNIPGLQYEYASINYDIIGLIIERIAGMAYEEYMYTSIFKPLGLKNTIVQVGNKSADKATGYKISFFFPLEYEAPLYRGNGPAAYIISNGNDISTWLRLQMGLINSPQNSIVKITHIPDKTIPLDKMATSFYAMGWEVSEKRNTIIRHTGLNPNFSTFIAFISEDSIGVAVLANSNSSYTDAIGEYALRWSSGERNIKVDDIEAVIDDYFLDIDTIFSVISMLLMIYLLSSIAFLLKIIFGIQNKKKRYKSISRKNIIKLSLALTGFMLVLMSIYLTPHLISGVSWETAIVWSSVSFPVAAVLLIISSFISYLIYSLSQIFS